MTADRSETEVLRLAAGLTAYVLVLDLALTGYCIYVGNDKVATAGLYVGMLATALLGAIIAINIERHNRINPIARR